MHPQDMVGTKMHGHARTATFSMRMKLCKGLINCFWVTEITARSGRTSNSQAFIWKFSLFQEQLTDTFQEMKVALGCARQARGRTRQVRREREGGRDGGVERERERHLRQSSQCCIPMENESVLAYP